MEPCEEIFAVCHVNDLVRRRAAGYVLARLDENDNAAVAGLYNALDGIADSMGAGFCLIHHSSKGNQSDKAVTDVGSGAGAQSRAADTHLILRGATSGPNYDAASVAAHFCEPRRRHGARRPARNAGWTWA